MASPAGANAISVTKRLNNLMGVLDQRPDRFTDDGGLLRDSIVEKAISFLPSLEPQFPWQTPMDLRPEEAAHVRSLSPDGFTVSGGALRREMPEEISLVEAESELMQLLKKHGLVIPHGHLTQALDAHGRGNWAAANGQIRTFIDALLDEITVRIDPAFAALNSGQQRRAKLASIGFLSKALNEWDDNGLGFINGLVKRLHPQGAHPGLSDDSDSTFRLHVVLITARLLMVRYNIGLTKSLQG